MDSRKPDRTSIPVKGRSDGCLDRVPYASLMATLMCFIGVILFSIMMTWGFNATAEQTRRTLRIEEWPWLDKVQIFFIVLTVLMSLFALFFLAVGFTATGSTREEMYKERQAKCGGRCACAIAMGWTVALLICWLFIISIVSILCSTYFTFDDICLAMPSFSEADCMDFGIYEPMVRKFSSANLQLCGGDAQQFCALSSTAKTWYIVGWVGCCVVILGLAMFLGIHAANYAHVGNASRYIELRDLVMDPIPAPPSFPPPRRYSELNDSYGYGSEHHQQAERSQSRSRDRKPSAFSQNYNDDRRFAPSTTSTRMADQMSDSVSQYQYGNGRKYNGR